MPVPTQITGSPIGNVIGQDDIVLDGAPNIYFQEKGTNVAPLNNPDSDGFYWNLSGSSAYPVYALGCFEGVTLGDNLTMNQIRCDVTGDQGSILRRNYLELKLTVKSLFKLDVLRHLIKGGAVTVNSGAHTEKFGLGPINNNRYYQFWLPKVYDDTVGSFFAVQLHRARFDDAFTIGMVYGAPWTIALTIHGYADVTKPSAQSFGTVVRLDPTNV